MKKPLISVAAASALAMSATSAFAVCVAQGGITRILVNPGPIDPFTTGDGRATNASG